MKEVLKELVSTVLYLVIVFCAVMLVIHYVGQRTIVEGESMEPTLYNQDNLITDKITYRFSDPERFDIIMFPYRYADEIYIKRIIGLPGETVRIDEEGNIYINGEILEESYGKEVILPDRIGLAAEEIKLGEDEYFVLGDNRNNSKDSRYPEVGNIKRDEIIGRAWVRIWPLSEIGVLKHR